VSRFVPLDPYQGGAETPPLTGDDLAREVAFYKATADEHGEPYDPEWDRWLADDRLGRDVPEGPRAR